MAEARTATLTREDRRLQFIESGWWVSIPLATVPAHWLYRGENRLDGGYYTAKAKTALRVISDCGFEIQHLAKCTENIFVLNRFRRVYARDKNSGWPYLSASEVLNFRPTSNRYIAKDHAPKLAQLHFAKPGWLLVTASGTVGRMVVVTKRLSNYFLTHDLIRIKPNETPYGGYLYAYLSSWMGQALVSKDQYGSAIKHLEPHHLAGVPVPLLPEEIQAEIHAEIMRAYALRDEANALLDEADKLLHEKLGLPHFDESLVPYLPPPTTSRLPANRPEMPHPKAFSIQASGLADRFDASFHVPIARMLIRLLSKGKYEPVLLRSMTSNIFIPTRFKRIYVSEQYGVPFLQGSHLPQMRPYDLKYLSLKANARHIDECLIRTGYVLVTRSGTIGRTGLVSSHMDKWAASEHLLRIVADRTKAHPGYIAAFLTIPYGQYQLTAKIYGGVVDELTEEDTRAVWIPNAPLEIQAEIGELVVKAFGLKDEASLVEERAIRQVEEILQNGKAA